MRWEWLQGGKMKAQLALRAYHAFEFPILFLSVALLVLSVSAGVQAQQTAGRILGSVLDPQGAAIPNAQITITNQDTGTVRDVVSESDGSYNAPQVLPGEYTV